MSQNIIEVTSQSFQEIIGGAKPALIDFFAEWCGPCRMMAPILDGVAGEFKDRAVVGKLNIDTYPELAEAYNISSVPTLILFKDGAILEKTVGLQQKGSLRELLEKHAAK